MTVGFDRDRADQPKQLTRESNREMKIHPLLLGRGPFPNDRLAASLTRLQVFSPCRTQSRLQLYLTSPVMPYLSFRQGLEVVERRSRLNVRYDSE
jgi:hypothetical protein